MSDFINSSPPVTINAPLDFRTSNVSKFYYLYDVSYVNEDSKIFRPAKGGRRRIKEKKKMILF